MNRCINSIVSSCLALTPLGGRFSSPRTVVTVRCLLWSSPLRPSCGDGNCGEGMKEFSGRQPVERGRPICLWRRKRRILSTVVDRWRLTGVILGWIEVGLVGVVVVMIKHLSLPRLLAFGSRLQSSAVSMKQGCSGMRRMGQHRYALVAVLEGVWGESIRLSGSR